MPKFNSISISGVSYARSWSKSSSRVSLHFSRLVKSMLESALKRGLDIDDFAPRLSFFGLLV